MKTEEEKVFNYIKKRVPENVSLIDDVSDVLDINYDAAYRRIKGKTALSLTEILKLTQHYNFSISDVFHHQKDNIVVRKTNEITNTEELADYFQNFTEELTELSKINKADILFAAKDMPIYYGEGLFRKFKMYVYLNVLTDQYAFNKIPFSEFDKHKVLENKAKELELAYENICTTEIWNEHTLSSTINRILYFFKIKVINKLDAIEICKDFYKVIKKIENQSITQKKGKGGKKYELFKNDLLSLNNTLFCRYLNHRTLFIPFTSLSLIKISDKKTNKTVEKYFYKQLQFSKEISGNSEIERTIFFNSLYEKIEQLKKQIEIA